MFLKLNTQKYLGLQLDYSKEIPRTGFKLKYHFSWAWLHISSLRMALGFHDPSCNS